MMDAAERELLAKSLEHATAQVGGEAVDAALDELGWRDALEREQHGHGGLRLDREGLGPAHRLQGGIEGRAGVALDGALDPVRLAEVTQLLYAFRSRSRATQHRMAAGDTLGPETSIDKVLLATTEQAVFDLVAETLVPEVTIGDDPASERWRTEFLYSRAASIYGGSAEIQRNIIARRLLDLGTDR